MRAEFGYADAFGVERVAAPARVAQVQEALGDVGSAPIEVCWDEEPLGYSFTDDGRLRVRAPTQAHPLPRGWGMFVPLYALRGASDLKGLAEFGRWAEGLGAAIVATTPLLSTFAHDPSPYAPISRLFWSEHYLAVLEEHAYVDYSQRVPTPAAPAPAAHPTDPLLLAYARFRGDEARHVALQAALQQALAAIETPLCLDLPIGVHADGFDVHHFPFAFCPRLQLGAPPDQAFPTGQNWRLRPYHAAGDRARGYPYFRALLQANMRYARALRIDHIMGLHRQYCIPEGQGSDQGVYVSMPAEELYAIMLLESHRNRCALVGEDLGTVPAEVRAAMDRHGVHRMFIRALDPGPVPHGAVAYLDTHDTLPFAATHPPEGLGTAIAALMASGAALTMINVEDLWGETRPQNVPGTEGFPNWCRRTELHWREISKRPRLLL
jgi:4-alpha-glucanotransferase